MFKAIAVVAISIALFGCASVPMGDAARDATLKTFQAPAGRAGIHVYRNESMGVLYARTTPHLIGQAEGQKGVAETRLAAGK